MKTAFRGSFTVEAAGVMAAVLVAIMIIINLAFRLRTETVGSFRLHETVERERHLVEHIHEIFIQRNQEGNGWELEISAPVFRPENFLRMWSLAEDVS